ncbi:MAG: mannose-1-phosphate guanylyltransferase/mannose-6-phosphate isomerase [Candidatus Omnitrophica bacterium]|nr:mannose-1-phosphate guanylyltransferase/mannose-6-phosphate isomerase [Candidatus Omnitrophota bacterium]
MKPVAAYIMAGGSGMRLWPMSRAQFPKQLHALLGEGSLLQQTIRRTLTVTAADHILIGTREDLYFSVINQWQEAADSACPWMVLEPLSRNTAPAIALALLACRERFGQDVIMITLAADHVIKQPARFRKTLKSAVAAARRGKIVTFGVVPAYAETGYGYIKSGAAIAPGIFSIAEFKEKPNPEQAQAYVRSGDYLWNSGMFVFDTAVFAATMQRFCPQVWNAAQAAWRCRRQRSPECVGFPEKKFARLPNISVDYAVMEKTPDSAVIKADFTWCDVGCWHMVHEMSPRDAQGNTLSGNIFSLDTKNCFIKAESRFVAAVGMEDAIVIDTPDALLLARKERSQDVKKIVEQLDARKSSLTKLHTTVYRPWGNYTVLGEGPGFLIKRVVVNPLQQLSLQKHTFRSEHWVVISGKARVIRGEDSFVLEPNESLFIPRGKKHRLVNPLQKPLTIIEVQTGATISEDDIVRYADVYQRV